MEQPANRGSRGSASSKAGQAKRQGRPNTKAKPHRKALTEESEWWTVAHALSEASTVLAGTLTARADGDSEHEKRLRLIPEMIYAFSVECWLKGMLVASLERAT